MFDIPDPVLKNNDLIGDLSKEELLQLVNYMWGKNRADRVVMKEFRKSIGKN